MSFIGLFFQFMKYGLLCFGGGYMIIPLLYTDFVQKTAFFTPEDYGNLLSVAQMTPGPVSINTATYVGFVKEGVLGAITASVGLCIPTFILCLSLMSVLCYCKDKPLVAGFLKGAKWAAFIMILSAIILFSKISVLDVSEGLKNIRFYWLEVCVMIGTIILTRKMPFTVLLFLSAVLGWSVSFFS